jgi:hypothetical protein
MHDGEDCKVVVPHLHNREGSGIEPQGCGDMAIPTRSVLKMTLLNVPGNEAKKQIGRHK